MISSSPPASCNKDPNSSINIIWFRNDLRLLDNPTLFAAQQPPNKRPTLCIYCFDPRHFQKTRWGSLKTAPFRSKFLLESVKNLRASLLQIGSQLLVTHCSPEVAFAKIVDVLNQRNTKANVLIQGEVTHEELVVEHNVERVLSSSSHKLVRFNGTMLYDTDTFPFRNDLRDMPNTFTKFRLRVEEQSRFRQLYEKPSHGALAKLPAELVANIQQTLQNDAVLSGMDFLPTLSQLYNCKDHQSGTLQTDEIDDVQSKRDTRGVLDFIGGEDAGLRRLEEWMFTQDHLHHYFEIRNGMVGADYSSKLSPYLALGCVSARFIAHEAKRYEKERGIANKSTYWILFELLCREFFRCICAKYGNGIFQRDGPLEYESRKKSKVGNHFNKKSFASPLSSWLSVKSSEGKRRLEAWKDGLTGIPIVDANMRELKLTGWMSNRGRQIVASYLIHELKVDWRAGADHFESLLLDHDVCSNYGNWASAAALLGGRINRFNMEKQSRDYDPNGEYIKLWLPELSRVQYPAVVSPWKMSSTQLKHSGVILGEEYPRRILEETEDGSDNRVHEDAKRKSAVFSIKEKNRPPRQIKITHFAKKTHGPSMNEVVC